MTRKLEVGSGNRPLPGYEHLDLDARCPDLHYVAPMDAIPVEPNTFDEVRSIHVIEHTGWRNGPATLAEWFRVLKPGGVCHIATPNLRFICKAYLENDHTWYEDMGRMYPEEQQHLVVAGFHSHTLWANFKIFSSGANGDEHFACYDGFVLGHMLSEAGFVDVKILEDSDSLIMEARKP